MFRLATLALLLSVASAKLNGPKVVNDRRELAEQQQENIGKFKITVTNSAFQQPMSRFFATVHSADAPPLYEIGKPATTALALLAENGDPQPLVDLYSSPIVESKSASVRQADIVTDGALIPGEPRSFIIYTTATHPYLSFASMAVNTNDCFVGVSSLLLKDGLQFSVPGLDAGSEENNELCRSIPGPACAGIVNNERSGNGEGFVHVHRGIQGVGPDLSAAAYDWRNPMLQIAVQQLF